MGHKVKADPGGEGGDPRIRIVSNIFISFLGAGVLGLPYAFKESGLLEGAIVMTFVSIISVKAMLLIVDAKYLILAGRKHGLIKEVINDEISYSDVGDAAFGHAGRLTIDTALLVSQLGFCCAYLIFISETLSSYFTVISKTQCLFLMLPPLFGLTLIKDLSQFSSF
ncbi:SLC36A [Lepeophtheirus salmonis]|uniref:SLC36A n=1 Tax=Lepeophtheirus salmonis TaxID=72036 RepID=A0A7R8D043_LEPSM|nr:SLC36A [Lepeophtheirus salmonis]CAF2980617.1 SLC36A [Lepeophtheirus salmonis]